MKHASHKAQRGLNLIELLLVMAIVTAIAIGAFIIYPRVQASRAATTESTSLTFAVAQVQGIYTQGNYQTLSNEVAINADVFPASMVDGDNVTNQWGGAVTIQGALGDGTPNTTGQARYISITHEQVPTAVCKKLVPATASNFGTVRIDGNVVFDRYSNPRVAYNEATVAAACAASDPLTIAFTTR